MSSTSITRRLLVTALGGVTAATVAACTGAMSTAAWTVSQGTVALNPQLDQRPDPYKSHMCNRCPSPPPAS
jgi:hypothetical protein